MNRAVLPPRRRATVLDVIGMAVCAACLVFLGGYVLGRGDVARELEPTHNAGIAASGSPLSISSSDTSGDKGDITLGAPERSWSYYDGCNTTTCSEGSMCTTTLVGCLPSVDVPTCAKDELLKWTGTAWACAVEDIADTATFASRQYKTIRIEAPGYRCKRAGDGWTCERGGQ